MIHTTQQRQGAVPWIRHSFILCCCMLLLLGSGAGGARANQLYSATLPYAASGLTSGAANPTVLIVVYGEADVIEQRIKPSVANLHDFSLYPEAELRFSPDVGAAGIPLIVPEGSTDYVVTGADDVNFGDLSELAFVPIAEGSLLMMHPDDLLFFVMTPANIHTIEPLVSASGIILAFEVESLGAEEPAAPEPSSLLLLGIGLLSLVGLGVKRFSPKGAKVQRTQEK